VLFNACTRTVSREVRRLDPSGKAPLPYGGWRGAFDFEEGCRVNDLACWKIKQDDGKNHLTGTV